MATFSPTDAALEGFRILRERRRAVGIWVLANLVVSVVMGVLLITLFGGTLAQMEAMNEAAASDPAQALAMYAKLAPLYALMIPLGLVVIAVSSAAVYRIVLRPDDSAYGYLRLGRDEWRLVLLMLIYVALGILFTFVVTLAAGLIAGAALAMGEGIGALVGTLAGLAAVGAIIFVAVRMSLAGPMTFAEQRLRVFQSWTLTRGRFWRLFGAYALAVILMLIVFLLALIIYAAVATIVSGGDINAAGGMLQPDTASLSGYFTAAGLVWLVFGAVLGAVQNAIIYAPPAVVYRDLTGAAPEA